MGQERQLAKPDYNRIFPTEGEILLDGENVIENNSALSKIYFMAENNYYPESMTVKRPLIGLKNFTLILTMNMLLSCVKNFL
jgi:hypothetical protein